MVVLEDKIPDIGELVLIENKLYIAVGYLSLKELYVYPLGSGLNPYRENEKYCVDFEEIHKEYFTKLSNELFKTQGRKRLIKVTIGCLKLTKTKSNGKVLDSMGVFPNYSVDKERLKQWYLKNIISGALPKKELHSFEFYRGEEYDNQRTKSKEKAEIIKQLRQEGKLCNAKDLQVGALYQGYNNDYHYIYLGRYEESYAFFKVKNYLAEKIMALYFPKRYEDVNKRYSRYNPKAFLSYCMKLSIIKSIPNLYIENRLEDRFITPRLQENPDWENQCTDKGIDYTKLDFFKQ